MAVNEQNDTEKDGVDRLDKRYRKKTYINIEWWFMNVNYAILSPH